MSPLLRFSLFQRNFPKETQHATENLVEGTMIALSYDHGGQQVENKSGKKIQSKD
jgi:hypothetical protein